MTGAWAVSVGGARALRWLRAATCWLCAAGLLAGCTTPQPPAAPAAAPAKEAPALSASPTAPDMLLAFENQRRQQALVAERQGRLADAAWDWEILTVLRPSDAQAAHQLRRVRQAIDERVAVLMARADDDRRRGDLDRAVQGYLDALALSPRHAAAAQALRVIERERNDRSFAGRFARPPQARASQPATRSVAAPLPADRNLVEHVSMLAAQGEIDAAIQLLVPVAAARSADPSLGKLLADLHCRRAQTWLPARPALAMASLRECLRLDPSHANARAQLRSLQGNGSPP